jgi:enamine deaminase RidA (YjgF/YER057c/UK114 family)
MSVMAGIERRISSGSRFEQLASYSRAVIDDRYIYISGTVGLDPETKVMPEDAGKQCANIFAIIEDVLKEQGATLADVVRSRVFITEMAFLQPVVTMLGDKFRDFPPTNTTLLCGIPAPGAKVEIEVTALRPDAA